MTGKYLWAWQLGTRLPGETMPKIKLYIGPRNAVPVRVLLPELLGPPSLLWITCCGWGERVLLGDVEL